MSQYFKIIACEIAVREICRAVAQSPNIVDVEFLPQGLHDRPAKGKDEIQARLDAVPAGRYDAILVGYALCGNLINGLKATHTRLVVPRAHDCITFFLGSKERYAKLNEAMPGAYFYTSGWLECVRRRGETMVPGHPAYLPLRAGTGPDAAYAQWVAKYGEAKARQLLEVVSEWTDNYTHGVLIDFDFTQPLRLDEQVQAVCRQRGWQFENIPGDLRLLQRWVDGDWDEPTFLVVPPGQQVTPCYNDLVIAATPVTEEGPTGAGS
jgi:hypothetical protein